MFLVGIAFGETVSDMPNITSEKMTVCQGHRFSLEEAFRPKNRASKRLNDAFYAIF
jgi:hypothetical protein